MLLIYFELTTTCCEFVFLNIARNPEAIKEQADKFNHAKMNFFGAKKLTTSEWKRKNAKTNVVTHIIKDHFSGSIKSPFKWVRKKHPIENEQWQADNSQKRKKKYGLKTWNIAQFHTEMQSRVVPFSMTQMKKFGNICVIGKAGRKQGLSHSFQGSWNCYLLLNAVWQICQS